MSKGPKSFEEISLASSSARKILLLVPLFILMIKISIIIRIQGFTWSSNSRFQDVIGLNYLLDNRLAPANIWFGADAENYLRSLVGLVREGLYSPERNLHYWPAGYPILMWPLLILFGSQFFLALSILQSVLYAVATWLLVDEVYKSRLKRFAIPLAILLGLNPTMSLNTMAIGYEMPTVSMLIIALGLLMRNIRLNKVKLLNLEFIFSSMALSIAIFMQPRLIIIGIVLTGLWVFAKFRPTIATAGLIISLLIMLISPAILAFRNYEAKGFIALSTNLGVTMAIGAGPEATGGYNGKYNGVPCPLSDTAENEAIADSEKVKCVLDWYLKNPNDSIVLFANKARFFWSPWFGPEANGTMARNPWLMINPLKSYAETESGSKLVYGNTGKFMSWIWILLCLILMHLGFFFLWKAGSAERLLGVITLTSVYLNWGTSILTIGDHRFRIPTMAFSLLLQTIGIMCLLYGKKKRFVGTPINMPWPMFQVHGTKAPKS